MNEIRRLHQEAMGRIDNVEIAKRSGDNETAMREAGLACILEEQAAQMLPPTPESEPTRSVLYRSASHIALYRLGHIEKAIQLAKEGLRGHPPPEIEAELNDALRYANGPTLIDLTEHHENARRYGIA
jgi:hypothetical protein